MLSKIKTLTAADWMFIVAFDAAVLWIGYKWGKGDFE
jgi:hypothetical protein